MCGVMCVWSWICGVVCNYKKRLLGDGKVGVLLNLVNVGYWGFWNVI